MAATATVQEGYGSGPTWQDITSARYCTQDTYNPGSSNPCVVPSSGLNYSYWKHHRLKFTGTYTQITNVKIYCDGTIGWTLGTDGKVVIGVRDSGDNGCPTGSYDQATGTQGTTGDYMDDGTNGHAYYKDQTATPADITSYNSVGTALLLDSATITGDPAYSDSAVTQVIIDDDATQGTMTAETFTFIYDEV